MSKADMINHPPHYTFGENFEVIDVISDWGILFGFCVGSAIKYIARAQHKGNRIEDLEKGKWYINYLLKHIERFGNLTVGLPISGCGIVSGNVIKDWNLDKHEGLAIRDLKDAIIWNRTSLCEAQTIQSLTFARNQVALAIGKLTT